MARDPQNVLRSDPPILVAGDVVVVQNQKGECGRFQIMAAGSRYMRLLAVPDDQPLGNAECLECGGQVHLHFKV